MSNEPSFINVAIIGAGTMGSGIAGHIANAGHKVLLLDLPRDDDPNGVVKDAVTRLLKSDPPALMHKNRADLIELGNIRDDFDKLAKCNWIIEAVVERLDIKKDLYKRLDATISSECVVTSNTSTIPISLLVEDMPLAFRKRFAITHYFNPVRYMRLLELVQGEDTDPSITAKLAEYNDEQLGKGVVVCRDTPGFLGNRVGVFALQVGIDEAIKQGLSIEEADALMGRPMGIPKTGVFGLYDLIGVDLMSDVVNTLGTILPKDDVFHAIGEKGLGHNLITKMIAAGYTGDKGKGGFYRVDDEGNELAIELNSGELKSRVHALPAKAQLAADNQAANRETLTDLIKNTDGSDQGAKQTQFCRNVLARVLSYAAHLIPTVTTSPQDIDDAMKLGFNWVRGPFEMIDALGSQTTADLINEAGAAMPPVLGGGKAKPFYTPSETGLQVRRFTDATSSGELGPVTLPENAVRFNMLRRCLTPLKSNAAASLFALPNNLRLIEFHSKANALTSESMQIVAAAAADHGNGIIVHNDAQHFSAGVDLNGVLELINKQDWAGIDAFLSHFQQAVKKLKYAPVPVVGAPSGLAIGGGYEVLAHTDKVIAHGNSVLGLVEAAVGVVPGGGGVKETYHRWHASTGDWSKAAWSTWMQMGYARTGTSPEQSARLMYFLEERDQSIMNRDRLVSTATDSIKAMQQAGYQPPTEPEFMLADKAILGDMEAFMDKGITDGLFFPHDKSVAMAIAQIVVNHDGEGQRTASEDELYARERRAFIQLAKTKETHERISSLMEHGEAIRN